MVSISRSARREAFGAALAAALALTASSASAQATKAAIQPQPKGVSSAECIVFEKYLIEEVDVAIKDVSKGFLLDADRFVRSGCKSRDAEGEIHLVTRTDEDGRALRTARKRMGRIDILGNSGVAHCHRPTGGVCTTRVSSSQAGKQTSAELN